MKSKLKNKGKQMFFIGYRNNNGRGVLRMYDLVMRKVLISRDVLWLNFIYGWWRTKRLKAPEVENVYCYEIMTKKVVETIMNENVGNNKYVDNSDINVSNIIGTRLRISVRTRRNVDYSLIRKLSLKLD